jgi:hypothetical protein
MQRDGEFQRYQAFGISKAQELGWAQDRRDAILRLLDTRFLVCEAFVELVGLIVECGDVVGLHLLVNLVEARRLHLDTFTALRIAEELFRICGSLRSQGALPALGRGEIRRCIDHLLKTIDEQDYFVDPYYHTVPYLADVLSQERVVERVKRLRESVLANG